MVSVVRASKFRHVFGEEIQEKFQDIRPNHLSSESTLIKSNGTNVALAWESGNAGVLAVLNMSEIGRIPTEHPFIKGHTGPITDFDFNPFNDQQLISCSDDSTLKLWDIPQGGLTEDLNTPRVTLQGHSKKIMLVEFHPCAAYICASAGTDKTIKVWNIENAVPSCDFKAVPDGIFTLKWSNLGKALGFTCRDKKARVVDIRNNQVSYEVAVHEGGKPSKLTWIDETRFVTCGFSRMSDRQVALWDLRNNETPVKLTNIDQGSGVIYPFYDSDTNMLFLAGKGDGNIRYYEQLEDELHYVESFKSTTPCKGVTFIPKRKVDADSCEIMRALKLTSGTIDQISFKVPRRTEAFQDDIFPPVVSGEPSLSAEEWLRGEDREPVRRDWKNLSSVEAKAPALEVKTIDDYKRELEEKDDIIKKLQERVKELEDKLN